MDIQFEAFEYTADDTFKKATYRYTESSTGGWRIRRNGRDHLVLSPGYRLLRVITCGICATDLARRFLPFPLPQIIGHEALVATSENGETFAVEINDTCLARGEETVDVFCRAGLPTHCPTRRVFGIDRLPGGFGPHVLVPVNALVPTTPLDRDVAVLLEPFAAACHAVDVSPPEPGSRVAVLGPGRLGSLVLAALRIHRRDRDIDFRVTAVGACDRDLFLANRIRADEIVDMRATPLDRLEDAFDLVFDTTGSPTGFESALSLACREVHLKSTHGRPFHGISHLTELVVDELSILPARAENFDFAWGDAVAQNNRVYLSPGVPRTLVPGGRMVSCKGAADAETELLNHTPQGEIPRFDLAVAADAESLDAIIRPRASHENSLVRPRGAILCMGDGGTPLDRFVRGGGILRTSRCGDFRRAVDALSRHEDIGSALAKAVITHRFSASDLPEAYATARSEAAVKVVVSHK